MSDKLSYTSLNTEEYILEVFYRNTILKIQKNSSEDILGGVLS